MASTSSLLTLRLKRTWPVMLGISLFATALGGVWWKLDVLEISDDERAAYDDGLKAFTDKPWFPWGRTTQSNDFIVVAIDDKTFIDIKANAGWRLRYGSWPYDRLIYADLVEYLRDAGAKLVVFDATLDEPRADPTGDVALGQTLLATKLPLYLGFNVIPKVPALPAVTPRLRGAAPAEATAPPTEQPPVEDFPDEPADSAEEHEAMLRRTAERYAFPIEARGGLELRALPTEEDRDAAGVVVGQLTQHPLPTIETVADAVRGFGLVAHEEDDDGKMRKTAFAYTDGANSYVTLPVVAAADVLGATSVTIEPGWLTIGSRRIAIDADGSASIDYRGKLKARYRSISLVDVLRLKLRAPEKRTDAEKSLFTNKIVFLAGFALGTGDVKATPFEASTPGVHKQLATLDNLLHGSFITDAPFWVSLLFTFLVCFGSVALVLIVRNVFFDIAWPVALWAGFFLLTGVVLVLTDVHVLSAMPSLAGTLASVMATAWERLFADKERDRLKEMFRSYMEDDLVDAMVEQRELPKLDGEVKHVTAFFSDIRGFSSFSELFRDEPKSLMRLLNRYLSTVTPALRHEGACIDKYIGDAVVALFGAPVPHDDHALRACRGALAVQKVVGALREDLKREGLPDVYTRIGLNSDHLLVGNIGSAELLDYTAIGDGMNLAARLEAANKAYGTLILMGENTFRQVEGKVVAREVDLVRVAGKNLPSRIYELVGMSGDVPPEKLQVLARYAEALVAFRARRFTEAGALLDTNLTAMPDDGPSSALKERCVAFTAEPPPPEWDGVAELHK
ncbi:MAG: adenylate/guanylate cyclase domain-containing protein [Archangium sp.]|nr:adenylate/guanylate cyclase domain-containing protein [Archangium sp.]